jgi:hypothetical protein
MERTVIHMLCAQRIDARLGSALLVAGFTLQLLSTLGFSEKPAFTFIVLSAVAIAVLYYGLMRDLLATNAAGAIFAGPRATPEVQKLIESRAKALLEPAPFVEKAVAGA